MARRRLLFKLFPIYGTAILLCTVVIAWYAGASAERFIQARTVRSLEDTAWTFAEHGRHLLSTEAADRIQAGCEALRQDTGSRFTLVATDGTVLGDSHADPATMDNHAGRPEVATALTGQVGRATRTSATIGQRVTSVAVPIRRDGSAVLGVARVSVPDARIRAVVREVAWRVTIGGLLAAAVVGLLSLWVYHRYIAQPLRELQAGATRFAGGQLDQAVRVPDTLEMGALAKAFNIMGRRLSEQIATIVEQASEREAILTSMSEGVLAVDSEQQIISMNHAAANLLDADAVRAPGRPLTEVIRNADLLRLIAAATGSDSPVHRDITVASGRSTRHLAAHATPLHDAGQQRIGAVVVLNDITRLRELESIRQQFVANVSHELKTPITAIKAAVETIVDDRADTPAAGHRDTGSDRFLPVIARQADRLNAIVEDLLALARIEQSEDAETVPMAPVRILPLFKSAQETCQAAADARRSTVQIHCDPSLTALANDSLLHQAVVNLLDNAIKYSPPGQTVDLTAEPAGTELTLSVRDHGIGIEAHHLPRIFERFYRTDKARSRDLGGTGLGLAIVKHVAQVHGGRASVSSVLGEGSTFRLHLPAVADTA